MALFAVIGILGCRDAPRAPVYDPLRVSAGHQLTCFSSQSGSSAYARELVSPFATEHADLVHRGETAVELTPRPGSPHDASALCAHLDTRTGGIARTFVDAERACVVVFDTAASRDSHTRDLRLRVGLYRLESVVPLAREDDQPCAPEPGDSGEPGPLLERMVLRSNEPDIIEEIHILAMPLKEQWRRLIAREIDVIPSTPMMYHAWFEDMQTVETFPLQSSSALALYFNTQRPPWSSHEARHALSAALDLDAVARVACRHQDCTRMGALSLDLPAARHHLDALPRTITLVAMDDDSISMKAARAVSYQLRRRLGLEVHLAPRPITEILRLLAQSELDLLIMPLPLLHVEDGQALTRRLQQVMNWAHPELDAAAAQADTERVRAILGQHLPVLPLFQYMQFAAVDRRYCGAAPENQTSWRWLPQLYPCAAGSEP